MKFQTAPTYLAANPFLVWSGVAWKTAEMLMASAQVITHRTNRMALAGAVPNLRDQKEFTLMGREKLEAAAESAQAIALRMIGLNQEIGAIVFRQMAAAAGGMLSLAGSRTAQQTGALQTRLLRDAVAHTGDSASRINTSVMRIAQHGLKPIHSRATANARRLGKLKK
jgi:hypothetical protein